MAEAKLTAALEAVDNISSTLEKIEKSVGNLGQEVESLSNDFESNVTSSESMKRAQESLNNSVDETDRAIDSLQATLASSSASMQAANQSAERVGSTMDDLESEVDAARRSFESLSVVQGMSTATAATNAGAMKIAGNAIDEMGDDALKTAGQMGVLNTVMEELSLSGSALSVNIGAFNVSLRNLAPLLPIAASMGSVVTVMGAFISSLGAATVALGAFTAGGALAFMDEMQSEFAGLTNSAETLQAVMGGIKDLFIEALAPLETGANADFFVNLIEGAADLVNRLAQAISQMRDTFMPLFSGISDIISAEFDNIANGIEDMMTTMTPILLGVFEWFMSRLPDALRFMDRITQDLVGPIGNLGDSILDLLTSIIETATQIFQGLAPAFSVAVDIATALVDVFNTLSNGAMQAALFIGALVFAANKFVGIADTIANVGISAANTMTQWAGTIRNAGGALPAMNNALATQFEHLRALGQVLLGNMSIQEASGQVQKDLKEEYQALAKEILEAEDSSERLRNRFIELTAVMEGMDAEDAAQEIEEFRDSLDNTADSVDNNLSNAADSADEAMGGIGDAVSEGSDEMAEAGEAASNMGDDVADSVDGVDFSSVGTDELMDELKDTDAQISEVGEAADEMGEKLGPEVADAVSSSSDEIAGATDNIVEGVSEISKTGDEIDIRGPQGQFASLNAETDDLAKSLQGIDLDAVDVSDIEADNITDLRTELIRSSDNADELLDGVDNVSDALAQGPLSAGGMEPIITDESMDTINAMSGSLDEAGESALDFGTAFDDVDPDAMSIAIPQRLSGADQQASEAADRMGEALASADIDEGFDLLDAAEDTNVDEAAQVVSADMSESLGMIETEEFFDIADADMPDFSDMSDDMSTFNKEFETALEFGHDFDNVQLEQPFERADAAVENFDADMLAMADSADEIDLSGGMDDIDTSNLDKVKGKLGSLKQSVFGFGEASSAAMESAGESIADGVGVARDGVTDGVNSITSNLGMMKRAGKEQAAVLKRSFVEAGGVTGILGSGVTKVRNKLGAMKTSVLSAAGSLKLMAQSAWQSIKALAVQGAQAVKTTLRNWFLAFSQGGVVAGFQAMAASAWGAVTSLAATAAGALATAATFVAGLIPSIFATGLAFNTAFAGIPILLGAIVVAAAAVVGILGNMDGIASGLKGAFGGLKDAIGQIGNALLSVGVPAWNLFIDIMEMLLSPVFAIIDGFKLIGEALGLAGGEGGFLMGIIGGLLDGFSALMNILGAMFDFVAPAFSFIGDLIYTAFILPFQILAKGIKVAIQLMQGLVALAVEKIPFMSELVDGLVGAFEMVKNAIAEIPAFFDTVASMIGGTIDAIVGGIKDALDPAVDFINGLIRQANKVPKVDIDTVDMGSLGGGGGGASEALAGAQTTSQEVRDNVASDEEEPGDDVATEPDVNLSLEDSVENNVEVDANPEDKAQFSRIAKDALEEANSFARRRQGGQ